MSVTTKRNFNLIIPVKTKWVNDGFVCISFTFRLMLYSCEARILLLQESTPDLNKRVQMIC